MACKRARTRRALAVALIALLAALPGTSCKLSPDDLLVGVAVDDKDDSSPGIYKVFDSSGNYKDQITVPGCTTPTHDTDGVSFSADGTQIWATCFYQNLVTVLDATADGYPVIATLPGVAGKDASTYAAAAGPDGNMYIGYFNGPVAAHSAAAPAAGASGTAAAVADASFLALTADGRTLFYTSLSDGGAIRRYDLLTNSDLPTLAGGTRFVYGGLALLPPYDGMSGGLLVAICKTSMVQRLDGAGYLVMTYTSDKLANAASVTLSSDGTTFWAGDFDSGAAVKFDVETGEVLATIEVNAAGPMPSLYVHAVATVPTPTTCAASGTGRGLVVALGRTATAASNAGKVCALLGLPQTTITAANEAAVAATLRQCIGAAARLAPDEVRKAVTVWVKGAQGFDGSCVGYHAHTVDAESKLTDGAPGVAAAWPCNAYLPVMCGQL